MAKNILFIITGLFWVACNTETPKEAAVKAVTSCQDSTITDETQEITYSLPSPLQIAAIFKKSGMKYKEGLTSELKDPSLYATTLSKALNLGVYSADLSYALLNKQIQTAMEYMKLSRKMAEHLGMGSVYEANNVAKRFEKNIGNEDSLTVIISELQMEMDFYLDENSQQQITSVAFAGAWIESLYIASEVNKKNQEKVLNSRFSQQMHILESIINALKTGEKKDPTISKLVVDLQRIKDTYSGQPSVKNNLAKGEEADEKVELTDEEIAQISKEIAALRFKLIKGES
jgi:hypothetical protein